MNSTLMDIAKNTFKTRLKENSRQTGFWLSSCSDAVTEMIGDSDFGWVMIDAEHSPNEVPTILGHLRILQASATNAVVRPPANEPVIIKRLLDCGAQTLLLPMVNNQAEAEAAVAAVRYPPHGIRGVSMGHRANRYGRIKDYHVRAEADLCVVAQIETTEAMDALEQIGGVDGIDAVFIGPGDLSADMGYLGDLAHPVVKSEIASLVRRAQAINIPIGTLVTSAQAARESYDLGMSFVAIGTDLSVLRNATDQILRDLAERGPNC